MTDAAHLLVDFLSFMISLLSLWLSSRPATHRLNYGWHRAGAELTSLTHRKVSDLINVPGSGVGSGYNWAELNGDDLTGSLVLQRFWALCCQSSPSGWSQRCWSTWRWSVSSTMITPSRAPSCSSPPAVPCWPILCEWNVQKCF